MGGYGSTRWDGYRKKTTVESCYKLTIKALTAGAAWQPGAAGKLVWSRGGERLADIGFSLMPGADGRPSAVRLMYSATDRAGDKAEYDHPVKLAITLTAWGSPRYWFICPLIINGQPCRRRVAVLYLPPGGRYFGCRHCYNLAYRSSQEQHESDFFYRYLAAEMQANHPGMTAADMRYMWDDLIRDRNLSKPPPAGGYYAQELERRHAELIAELLEQYNRRWADYLSAGDLCEKSGLDPSDLARLEAARLLLPDHEGLYRPKLEGWARKLAALLAAGWEVSELKAWARGRWATDNPRAWPPDRAAWTGKS